MNTNFSVVQKSPSDSGPIFFSIIVATNQFGAGVLELLRSIQGFLLRRELLEVIVVINGSDGQELKFEPPKLWEPRKSKIRLVFEPVESLLAGRHRGAVEARGDVLAYLDDDVIPSPGWFDALVQAFDHPGIDVAGGPSIPLFEHEPPVWMEWFVHKPGEGKMISPFFSLLDLGPNTQVPFDLKLVWGLNFAIRKTVLFEAGGFNPDLLPGSHQMFQGDGETGLAEKLVCMGKTGGYFPGLKVHHKIPASRMTVDFIAKRAFYDGVAVEFSNLRSKAHIKGSIYASEQEKKSGLGALKKVLAISLWPVPGGLARAHPLFAKHVFSAKGRRFLRYHYRKYSVVRNWVAKPNYLEWEHPDLDELRTEHWWARLSR